MGCGSREKLWRDTLLTLDRDLLLVRKQHSMLTLDLAQYLFARSSSHINSLISLIAHGPCNLTWLNFRDFVDRGAVTLAGPR